MDQYRRDAMHWAEEWNIRQRNRKIITAVIVVIAVILLGFVINYVSILGSRTVYGSEEEMKAALQGRFVTDYAEDIEISGDDIMLTYYNQSHYDLDYAEEYGYSEYDDSVYEDRIVKWDYRRGAIECDWMDTITVDKDGNLVYYHQTYRKTDEPRPEPLDPTELSLYKKGYSDSEAANSSSDDEDAEDAEAAEGMTEEEQAAQEASEESREETQAAAEEAGIEGQTNDV